MHNHWGCFVSELTESDVLNLGIKRRSRQPVPLKHLFDPLAMLRTLTSLLSQRERKEARDSESARLYLKTNRHCAHRLCQRMNPN
jgi:hypothetical protein